MISSQFSGSYKKFARFSRVPFHRAEFNPVSVNRWGSNIGKTASVVLVLALIMIVTLSPVLSHKKPHLVFYIN